ncbi:MAG TPA: LLM class flavin-dependent oxidoreductase [Acidimicrobiia bacterium]|nr:LLM class flavin-dependent oxidoreductase [Acidimicrobiia bacterium]
MKFGIFYELQVPRPWDGESEHRVYREALEQIELADRLGIDYVWEVEHHFLEEYSHSSAPEVFLAAVSQRTSRIRLGHGIVQLPSRINHPARVAERIAALDLVSDGRVEFGTGESTGAVEPPAFGVDLATKRDQWRESLDAITRMFVEEPFAGYEGEWFRMEARNVVPKPYQRPHPPLWMACPRPDVIPLAARAGIGALCFSMLIEPEQARDWVEGYYTLLESDECVPAGFAVNAQLAVVTALMCNSDEQTALDRGLDGSHFLSYSLLHYYNHGDTHAHGTSTLWEDFERDRHGSGFDRREFERRMVEDAAGRLAATYDRRDPYAQRGAIGTPAQVREFLRRYEDAGCDQVILFSQVGRNRHEDVCESLELFAREVLPEFAERDEERSRRKAERLAPVIERALARRELPRTLTGGKAAGR